jgi:lambda family phage minor tail protein L
MTANAQYRQAQQLSTDALVELYELDTTTQYLVNGVSNGGAQWYWTPGSINGPSVVYQGLTYISMPIQGSDFEWSGQGKLPQPKLQLNNVYNLATALVLANNDLLGATVRRLRVFQSNLDGEPNADPTLYFEPDVFFINRKSAHTKEIIEFELRAPFDAQGIKLPRRQIIRDTCGWSYRAWNAGTSSFVQGACPYTGTSYFDDDGNSVTDPSLDVCGKRLTDCMARFGASATLPTAAFPGAGLAGGTP